MESKQHLYTDQAKKHIEDQYGVDSTVLELISCRENAQLVTFIFHHKNQHFRITMNGLEQVIDCYLY